MAESSDFMDSGWRGVRTFFPVFIEMVTANPVERRALVVGSADDKYVAPLLSRGFLVSALDFAPSARADTGFTTYASPPGLTRIVGDFRDTECGTFPVVWTSCSWHYSVNHDRPLARFVERLIGATQPGGVLGMEYFMPLTQGQVANEHYPEMRDLQGLVPQGWSVLFEAETRTYVEAPHPGQHEPHNHRLGFLVVRHTVGGKSPLSWNYL